MTEHNKLLLDICTDYLLSLFGRAHYKPLFKNCSLGWTRFLDQQERKISYGMRV